MASNLVSAMETDDEEKVNYVPDTPPSTPVCLKKVSPILPSDNYHHPTQMEEDPDENVTVVKESPPLSQTSDPADSYIFVPETQLQTSPMDEDDEVTVVKASSEESVYDSPIIEDPPSENPSNYEGTIEDQLSPVPALSNPGLEEETIADPGTQDPVNEAPIVQAPAVDASVEGEPTVQGQVPLDPPAEESIHLLTTGCSVMDKWLGGGIPAYGITDLCGEKGTGRTQLCLQLAITAQLPISKGGLDSCVLYICSEARFCVRRFNEMVTYFQNEYPGDLPSDPSEFVYVANINSAVTINPFTGQCKASLGKVWQDKVNHRLKLWQSPNLTTRFMLIEFSTKFFRPSPLKFVVGANGVRAAP